MCACACTLDGGRDARTVARWVVCLAPLRLPTDLLTPNCRASDHRDIGAGERGKMAAAHFRLLQQNNEQSHYGFSFLV